MTQTRVQQIAKEIVAYIQNNVGDTQDCRTFATDSINRFFVERKRIRKEYYYVCSDCGYSTTKKPTKDNDTTQHTCNVIQK